MLYAKRQSQCWQHRMLERLVTSRALWRINLQFDVVEALGPNRDYDSIIHSQRCMPYQNLWSLPIVLRRVSRRRGNYFWCSSHPIWCSCYTGTGNKSIVTNHQSSALEGCCQSVGASLVHIFRDQSLKLFTGKRSRFVHQRDVVRNLIKDGVSSQKNVRPCIIYALHTTQTHWKAHDIPFRRHVFLWIRVLRNWRAIGADPTYRQVLLDIDSWPYTLVMGGLPFGHAGTS